MASTSCVSHHSNVRARSWLLSPDKAQGRVAFLPLRQRDGFRPQVMLMAAGPTSSSSNARVHENLLHSLLPTEENSEQDKKDPITDENLDEWIMDSVQEIVKHIGEAPFLVQIFSKGEKNEGIRVEREATTPDAWPHIQKRWARKKKSQPPPDGIILVSELKEEHAMEHGDRPTRSIGSDCGLNQVWGLLVQRRGMECVACYILNTCRVFSPAGCCTHFYVARAQCFGDPIDVQMRNVWLQSKRRSE